MRTIFPALLLTLSVHSCLVAAPPDRAGLGRSFTKLKDTGALTVGYFGGSITAGAGASKPEFSYRGLTTKWFRENFPTAKITEVNAAIGGTGSDLGAFRCHKDLLEKNPDLVFVEYAVNDGGAKPALIEAAMEGIVRQIWKANPAADIIFVYTTAKSLAASYDRGETPPAVVADEKIAAAYGIPSIDMGKTLWQQFHDGKAGWDKLLPDNTHPSDMGYAIYGKDIATFLEEHKEDKPAPPVSKLRNPVSPLPWENAHLIEAPELPAPEGWTHDEPSAKKQFPHNLSSAQPGSVLKYKFTGTAIGVYWVIAPDSGDIEWSIDGGTPQHASSWDSYALRFSRANYKIFDYSLAPGEHELVMKVLQEGSARSTGTWIRIGALLVN